MSGGRGLGRGLAALISSDAGEAAPGGKPQDQLVRLSVEAVLPNPEQPRDHFDATALEDLAASIRAHGVLVPLVARRDVQGRAVLIAGERRLRAAKLAGLRDVPVVLLGAAPTAAVQLELALIENLQREDLDPVEAATGYRRLVQVHGHTQETVAQAVGKDRATIANALRLLKLPEAGLTALRERRISAGHARALLALEDPMKFAEALATVTARDLSVRATETLVRSLKRPGTPKRPDRAVVRFGEELTRRLGTRVAVQARPRGGGKIVIDFRDGEDLARINRLLGG